MIMLCRYIAILFFTSIAFASQPLLTITPIFKAPTQLANNSFTAAIYQITNNTKTFGTYSMQPIQGITQITNITGACSNPILLGPGQSCNLNLRIIGNQLAAKTLGGPVICNHGGTPFACSQPSPANSLAIVLTFGGAISQNSWIKVLIAQDAPPADTATYVNQIIALAPSVEQIHLRVDAGETNYSFYAQLINLLRTAYSNTLLIGFHPDNSNTSYAGWGCTVGDWQCVLNASILNMNAMNAVADPSKKGLGFNIFSLEQSYVEPADPATLQAIKACLNPAVAASTAVCPVATIASPVVTFGDVLPSYGGCDPNDLSDCEYGTPALDYGYPQYYNLGKNLPSIYSALVTNGYFPEYSAENCINSAPFPYTVVDADTNGAYPQPKIPCTSNTPNVYTYPDPTTGGPSPTLASAYVAYLMTQLPPISDQPFVNGATVYITFSGEPQFLGAPGWTLNLIYDFYTDINSNFASLKTLFPSLFPQGGADPSTIQYAIWNFTSILGNE